jgi:hypothetical protein
MLESCAFEINLQGALDHPVYLIFSQYALKSSNNTLKRQGFRSEEFRYILMLTFNYHKKQS